MRNEGVILLQSAVDRGAFVETKIADGSLLLLFFIVALLLSTSRCGGNDVFAAARRSETFSLPQVNG